MKKLIYYFSSENIKLAGAAVLISLLISSVFLASYAYGEAVSLTVTVQSSLTFSTATDVFGNLTPGTAKFATTTLSVTTNNTAGFNITLYGDDQSLTNTVLDLTTDASVGITDQLEWIPASATTSAGNAVQIGSLDSSGDVLAFRVMTASGSAAFLAPTWWGSTDAYSDNANTLWAGIASSTAANLKIGNAGTGSYSASTHRNTVLYYLDVASTQQTGSYSGGLTYTATAN